MNKPIAEIHLSLYFIMSCVYSLLHFHMGEQKSGFERLLLFSYSLLPESSFLEAFSTQAFVASGGERPVVSAAANLRRCGPSRIPWLDFVFLRGGDRAKVTYSQKRTFASPDAEQIDSPAPCWAPRSAETLGPGRSYPEGISNGFRQHTSYCSSHYITIKQN